MRVKLGEKKEALVPEIVDASAIVNGKSDHNPSADLARFVKNEVSTDLSVEDLESILKTEFPPSKIKSILVAMTQAEDTKATARGDFFQTPNWDVRDKALTKILRLLGHIKNEQGAVSDQIPTKIVFNVINKQVNIDRAEVNNELPAD